MRQRGWARQPDAGDGLGIAAAFDALLRATTDPADDDRVPRARAFVLLSGTVMVPVLLGFVAEILLSPDPPVRVLVLHLVTVTVLVVGGVVALRRSDRLVGFFAGLTLFVLAALTLGAWLFVRSDFSILWVGVLPVLALFVFPLRTGLLWCGALLGVWLWVLLAPERFAALGAPAPWLSPDQVVDFALAFCALVVVGTAFEVMRLHARSRLVTQADSLIRASRLEAVGHLSRGVAHDFNNLLTVIDGNLELVEADVADRPEAREGVADARQASHRAAELVAQLLAFARKQSLTPGPVDVAEIFAGMAPLIDGALGRRTAVRTDIVGGPLLCHADATRLENAIVNLVMNAHDAMPEGGEVKLSAAMHRQEDATLPLALARGDYVRITVADTGPGIPPALRGRVFDPFFTTKAPGAGSGLGLSAVHGFAVQSGGAVRIEDVREAGARISIYLPTPPAPHAAMA